MSFDVEPQLAYNLANAAIRGFPYPHLYVPDVFPAHFYAEIQANMPEPVDMLPISEARPISGYKERFVLEIAGQHAERLPDGKKQFWKAFSSWLLSGHIRELVLAKFAPIIQQRFKGQPDVQFYDEALLIQDMTDYKIGPHTDAARKVVSLLFYLPKDESQAHLGTSVYLPKDPRFTCPGGPHHSFDKFVRVATMPFKPNSLFAFVKTDRSFHGVEPVRDPGTRRWLLLYDIYVRPMQAQAQPEQPAAVAAPSPGGVTFKF
jgi:hypothetical protein